LSARIAAIATLVLVLAAASTAAAASLTVRVAPRTVHPGRTYRVVVTGRYDRRAHARPYLLVFIQYSRAACKRRGTAEYALPARDWSWDVYPQHERHSPFRHRQYWKATGRPGTRRVCAYLYAKQISSVSRVAPLATASALFRVGGR
jgi:hypothetical protein